MVLLIRFIAFIYYLPQSSIFYGWDMWEWSFDTAVAPVMHKLSNALTHVNTLTFSVLVMEHNGLF